MYRRALMAIIAVVAALASAVSASAATPRVIGGSPAPAGAYPYVAALAVAGVDPVASQVCSGTLVAPDIVLAASSCVAGAPPEIVSVVLGRQRLSATTGETLGVKAIIPYKEFDSSNLRFDAALIRLTKRATGSPAAIAAAGTPLPATVTIVGWGESNADGARPDDLQEATVPVLDDATCANAYGTLYHATSMFCAGELAGAKGSCAGDSGAPALGLIDGQLRVVGLTIGAVGCGRPGFPALYTRITEAGLRSFATSDPEPLPVQISESEIHGHLNVGQTVRCDPGEWESRSPITFTFAWVLDATVLDTGSSPRLKLLPAHRGSSIVCVPLATNTSGSTLGDFAFGNEIAGPLPERVPPRAGRPHARCHPSSCQITVTARDRGGSGVRLVELAIRGSGQLTLATARGRHGQFRATVQLAPGRYTVLAVAIDRDGNRQTRPTTAAIVVGARRSTRSLHVIAGTPSTDLQFPFVGALVQRDSADATAGLRCGGSLIAPTLFLTAGHCLYGSGPDDWDVVLGRNRLSGTGGQRIHGVGVSWHPDFSFERLGHDVALLRLEHAPVAPVTVAPLIDAAHATATDAGSPAQVVGWGATYDSGDGFLVYPDDQRTAAIAFVSDADCARDAGRPFDAAVMVCAGTNGLGQNACYGDSGGPLLVPDGAAGWQIAGVVSWGLRCGSHVSPNVYARVLSLRDWILSSPPDAPVRRGSPELGGDGYVGSTLRCLPNATGTTLQVKYTWLQDGAPIANATGPTLKLRATDNEKFVGCRVAVSNPGGSLPLADSELTQVMLPPPLDRVAPKLRKLRLACSRSRCKATVHASDNFGVVAVDMVVDVETADGHRTRWLSARQVGPYLWRLLMPWRRGGTYTIAARAIDGAGHASATAQISVAP